MTDNEIIGKAFEELSQSSKLYMMFGEFSFLKELDNDPATFQKYRFLISRAEPFEKHSDHGLKFSAKGIEIKANYGNWEKYLKSKKKKLDWIQLGILIVGAVTIVWNIIWSVFLFKQNDKLEKEVTILKSEIRQLSTPKSK